ncbi:hypothetical protein EXU85_29740 [Spirosoma sp. KCTC 42546]|uniref:hypothetical protein n=1 Tax=Spirosoma sp. KCTC 42546 TaxID=2520506 RepID=UPI001156F253|nr:hypothetical protein [Spirosoma sp. KCTC 42546]QDK77945.1 hypothetical protein EXU85_04800 [Spirosoma sp. KCTC 42546]QDK82566.1 hypothetical protein EXU85_29740 [Spirosoma sp. KCTC 42546]
MQNADDNGLLLHQGLLTHGEFVPLGLPVEQVIQRDRTEFGKHHARKQPPFAEKKVTSGSKPWTSPAILSVGQAFTSCRWPIRSVP